jgi:predicted ATPase
VASLSPLIGRAEELGLVEKLVQEHRLVTVTGTAGVGKTRLVEELAVHLTAAGERVISVRLDDLPAGSGAAAIVGEAGMGSPEALALASTGERIVVVLDGCDHVLAGAVDVVLRFSQATDAGAVLTTSRQPLGVAGERVVALDPLGVPVPGDPDPTAAPAVALFFELITASGARWDRSDRTVQAVADVCRAVDGLPLAVELAAARARTLSPAEVLELVTQRTDTLVPPGGPRAGGPRGIDDAIAVSVGLLDDDQHEVFRRLGVLTGAFDLGLVHAVAGPVVDDHLRAVELVGALVERSLVVAEPSTSTTRYRMLQVVREHALADLKAAGLAEETWERLATAMVAEATDILIEGSQRWSGDLIARITTRTSSFVASLEWCIAHDEEPDRAYALFVPLFAPAQEKAADVQAIGSSLFARWPDTPGPLRAEALAVSATAHVLGYHLDAAVALADAALADPDGTPIATVLAERVLTLAAIGRDDAAGALDHARRGRAAAAAVPMPPFERELRGFEAALIDRNGDAAAASALAEEAIADSRAADDPLTEIWARLVAVTIDIRDGRVDEARRQLDQAQRRAAAIDDAWWGGPIARSRALLAAHLPADDGWRASRPLWRSAIERCARLGDLPELTLTLSTAAAAALAHGHADDADALLRASPHLPALTVLPEVYAHRVRHPSPDHDGERALVPAVRRALAVLAEEEPDEGEGEGEGAAPAAVETARLEHEGGVWALTYGGRTVRVRDLKGLGDLAVLLQRPGEDVHCFELMGATDVGDGTGPALDEQARREYQARILELQGDVDDAREANDPARAERAELELDALVTELSKAFGLGGRARSGGSSVERARTAVTYRIRAAIKKVGEQHEVLGTHLAHSVRTGTWCAYRPEREVRWVVQAG